MLKNDCLALVSICFFGRHVFWTRTNGPCKYAEDFASLLLQKLFSELEDLILLYKAQATL